LLRLIRTLSARWEQCIILSIDLKLMNTLRAIAGDNFLSPLIMRDGWIIYAMSTLEQEQRSWELSTSGRTQE
jgi:hypothetical protein